MNRIGPRMEQLCRILHRMGGTADAQSHVYLQLDYHGRSSNFYGSAAMNRAMRAGLIAVDGEYRVGHPVPVKLTEKGREVVS